MFYLVKGDNDIQVKATLTEDDGTVPDLRTATVRMKFTAKGSDTVLATLTSVAGADDAQNGIAYFPFTAANLDQTPGEYQGEIETTFDSGRISTVYEFIEFYLRDDKG